MQGFKAIGLSYQSTSIEVREKVAFGSEECVDFLLKLKETFGVEEALVVSTCNRTEIYYTSKDEIAEEVIGFVASFKAIPGNVLKECFQVYNTNEATEHLFRVALGLESQVLGDIQISNQVKRAYQQSADLNLAGPYLHRLMHTIFYANKRVVQETTLQDGTASVASVAVSLIDRFIANIDQPRIALIGLGEIGQNVLENLGNDKARITLINRTRAKAEKLAEQRSLEVRDMEELDEVISESDVIISAVAAKTAIIGQDQLRTETIHKLFIDLSVPRSIDDKIDSIAGVSLYNVDQLSERTEKARSIRKKAIPAVESIIAESMKGLDAWKNEMEVSPTIQRLKKALDEIRKDELARHSRVSDEERELLEVVTKNMIQKVIKLPVLQLKAACKRGEAETLVGVLNDLFNLEQQEVTDK
ncbi:MAG: glutamyl-tRNA reductase [Ekhidna sp.]